MSFGKSKSLWVIWRSVASLFHFLVFLLYLYALVWSEVRFSELYRRALINNVNISQDLDYSFPGPWKYLTRWNHMIHLVTFLLTFGGELVQLTRYTRIFKAKDNILSFGTDPKKAVRDVEPTLKRAADTLMHACAFPFGIFVTTLFWTLFLINPVLVVPERAETTPGLLNHIVHTMVGPIIFVESIIAYHRRPSNILALAVLTTVIGAYLSLVFILGIQKNLWVYGILANLDWNLRIAFIIGCILVNYFFFYIGTLVNRLLWSSSLAEFYVRGPQSTASAGFKGSSGPQISLVAYSGERFWSVMLSKNETINDQSNCIDGQTENQAEMNHFNNV